MKNSIIKSVLLACFIVPGLFNDSVWGFNEAKPSQVTTPPDFTKGGEPVGSEDHIIEWKHWAMGPTGAYIWCWAHPRTICSDGATQIYVIKTDRGTPADGKLLPGDVILGAAGGEKVRPFIKNARREASNAITEAEKQKNKGKLSLLVWRKGKTFATSLDLPVMGTYSRTMSAECVKSNNIIDQTADLIAKRGLGKGGIPNCLDALGLLATGEKKYLPAVREFAHQVGNPNITLGQGMVSWDWSYKTIFLCEYYLATGDKYVLPAIEKYATAIAKGRSGVGTWGHGMVDPRNNEGKPYGPVGGYGAMNATGIPLTIGLVLVRKCGVGNEEIDTAIKLSASFLRYFAEKGSIPYGDHDPFMKYYSNNGKNAEAAVLFDLLGDAEAATFFTAMNLASVREREEGHTGPYFSMAWGALGAACGGPTAADKFFDELRWYYEMQRRSDGDFRYQPVMLGGEEHGKYGKGTKWSCAGVALMHYSLPRRAIYLTGKGRRAAEPLTTDQVRTYIDVSKKGIYEECTTEQLLKLLEHRLPNTRLRAAGELATRDENVVPRLIAMLDSDNRYSRYGACQGLRYASRNSVKAADAVITKGLGSKDPDLRYFAALAFAHPSRGRGFTSAAKRAVPTLLKLAVTDDPSDPHRKLQATISGVLFYSGNARGYSGIFRKGKGLETVDRKLLIPAIKSILTNTNGGARSEIGSIYPVLTEKDLGQLWGDIYRATRSFAPSGVMFGKGIQDAGLRLMSKHKIKEGLELAAFHLMQDRHGKGRRVPFFLDIIKSYGTEAKPIAAGLKARRMEQTAKWNGMSGPKKQDYLKMLEKEFEEIEASTETPKLKSMPRYIKEID